MNNSIEFVANVSVNIYEQLNTRFSDDKKIIKRALNFMNDNTHVFRPLIDSVKDITLMNINNYDDNEYIYSISFDFLLQLVELNTDKILDNKNIFDDDKKFIIYACIFELAIYNASDINLD